MLLTLIHDNSRQDYLIRCHAKSFLILSCICVYLIIFLYGSVRYKDLLEDPYVDLTNLLKSCGNVCAIIYCLERTACDDLAAHLSKNGISCAGKWMFLLIPSNLSCLNVYSLTCFLVFVVLSAYHAGLNNKLRSSVLDDWITSKTQVVVATVAFGYGHTSNVSQIVFFPSIAFFNCNH